MDNEQLKNNLTSSTHWSRFLHMIVLAVMLYVAIFVIGAVVSIQFIFALITGKDNQNLRHFGHSLSIYIFQSFKFLTYASEYKPFPFADWPEVELTNNQHK